MPDDPNRPPEPQRDINGNPIPPPSFAPPPAASPPPDQKYDLAGNPLPSAAPPPGAPSYGTPPPYGTPPAAAYGQGPAAPYGQPGYYPVQVKGGQILTLGILSFFCFGIILGPMAYSQGTKALAAIDSGQADPSQRGQVSAGRICGLIGGILSAILIVIRIILLATGHSPRLY